VLVSSTAVLVKAISGNCLALKSQDHGSASRSESRVSTLPAFTDNSTRDFFGSASMLNLPEKSLNQP